MSGPTEQLLDLIFQAMDHAVQSIVNTNGPLVPSAIIESDDGARTLARFSAGDNPEKARIQARAHVAQLGHCSRYAIAADGTITEEGQRVPVIMVEAGDRAEAHGFCFIQRFASSAACRFAQPVRNPAIISQPEILRPRPAE